jgi:hypothetical protein
METTWNTTVLLSWMEDCYNQGRGAGMERKEMTQEKF